MRQMVPFAGVGDVEEGKILDVLRSPRRDELLRNHRKVSGPICPGFIDLQTNGAFGIDVGPDPEALEALARELPRTGTTSFLHTLISSPQERYADVLDSLEVASRPSGSRILGAHLEGPFLSPAYKGAHDAARMATETPAEVFGMPEKGRISPGVDADLFVLGRNEWLEDTIVAGEIVYARQEDET